MRSGVILDRWVLAAWVGRVSLDLTPIVARMAELIKKSDKLFMDETTAPVLDPGRGPLICRSKQSWCPLRTFLKL